MEENGKQNRLGLIGRNIGYSFSRGYFNQKFEHLGLNHFSYENFDIESIDQVNSILGKDNLLGCNVTIPYKEEIIPYLDTLDSEAQIIGAVNTIAIKNGRIKGYNTDVLGFEASLKTKLQKHQSSALILGTGGASKAVAYVLKKLGISYTYVSRFAKQGQLAYKDLDIQIIQNNPLIINCTPVGTHPNVLEKPPIPYQGISENHFLFDLIYNPECTAFLKEGIQRGASTLNGLLMLELQAEKAWDIWIS